MNPPPENNHPVDIELITWRVGQLEDSHREMSKEMATLSDSVKDLAHEIKSLKLIPALVLAIGVPLVNVLVQKYVM